MEKNALVLAAAFAVHEAIKDDDGFAGYDCSKEQFDRLYAEVAAVIEELVPLDLQDIENIVYTWFAVQESIAQGEVEVDWYLS